jgi:hypothetical protein
MFILKPEIESFTVVDGPFAGRDFKKGIIYSDIPPAEAQKFEKAKEEIQKPEPASKLKDDKNAANSKEKGGK